jgi:hypothetical protein
MRRTKAILAGSGPDIPSMGCRDKPVAASRQSPAVRAVLLHAAAIGDLGSV